MADVEHVEKLKQGVGVWNQSRAENSWFIPDLSNANLGGVILRGADLNNAYLYGANLRGAYLRDANLYMAALGMSDLYGVDLRGANLSKADLGDTKLEQAVLRGANLRGADLRGADLQEADLREVDLRGANLREANLRGSDLRGANLCDTHVFRVNLSFTDLSRTQALRTKFERTELTGACLADWNVNGATRFEHVICEYVYLKANQKERRPRKGSFKPDEFTVLFQQALDTIDLIFRDGIDWQAFFQSFQELRSEYVDQDLSIQAIERKQGGAFVVRVEVAEGSDKAAIESSAKKLYDTKLLMLEQRYRDVLQAKDSEIFAYKEQSANLMEIIKLQASRPINVEANAVAENNTSKYNLSNAQFAGGFAETVQGDQVGGTINNYAAETPSLAEAAAEIQDLLKQLEASNPTATEAEQTAFLNIMIPPTKRERFIGALKAGGGAAIDEIPYGPVLKALVEGWQKPNG